MSNLLLYRLNVFGALKNVDYSIITNNKDSSVFMKFKMFLHDNFWFYRYFAEENGGWGNCYYLLM